LKKLLAALAIVFTMVACSPVASQEYKSITDSTFPLVTISGNPYCTATRVSEELLLTAAHCLENGMGGMIHRKDGQLVSFVVVKADRNIDIALIKARVDGRIARLQTFEPEVYSEIVVAGYPVGVAMFITVGKWVGPIWDPIMAAAHSVAAVSVGPGNSGGGLWTKESGEYRLLAVVQMYAPAAPHVCVVSKLQTLKDFLSDQTL
jgi:S1-C subfamily serine protease